MFDLQLECVCTLRFQLLLASFDCIDGDMILQTAGDSLINMFFCNLLFAELAPCCDAHARR